MPSSKLRTCSHDYFAWWIWYTSTFKEVAVALFLYFFGWIDFSKVIVKLVKCQKMFCNKSCLSEKSKNNGKDGIVYRGTKKLNCEIDHLQVVSFLLLCSFWCKFGFPQCEDLYCLLSGSFCGNHSQRTENSTINLWSDALLLSFTSFDYIHSSIYLLFMVIFLIFIPTIDMIF